MHDMCLQDIDDSGKPLEACLVRRPPAWPHICIAWHLANRKWFACDNRRLFMLKVLSCTTARFKEVDWMEEFEDKLKQAPPKESEGHRHWSSNNEGIVESHKELQRRLREMLHASARSLFSALAAKDNEELAALQEEMRCLMMRVSKRDQRK